MSAELLDIIQLNNQNYADWKRCMKILLKSQNLWDIVIAKEGEHDQQWQIKDGKAQAFIIIAMDDDQIIHVNDRKSAAEMWQTLKNIHDNSFLAQVQLIKEICSCQMKENQHLDEHIENLSKLFEKMQKLNDSLLSDEWKVRFLLASLPGNYDNIVSEFGKIPQNDLTWSLICEKLHDEYTLQKGEFGHGDCQNVLKQMRPCHEHLSGCEHLHSIHELYLDL